MGWDTRLNPIDDPLFGLAFFVLLNATIRHTWSGPLFRALTWIGGISYSVYLTHIPVMILVKQVALRAHLPLLLVGALRLVAPLVAAYVFYRIVESRFLRASRDRNLHTG